MDSSPGRIRRTEVWISREEMVLFLLYDASSAQVKCGQRRSKGIEGEEHVLEASDAIRSKISLTNELRMAIALFEIPVSGWTCLRTVYATTRQRMSKAKKSKYESDVPL